MHLPQGEGEQFIGEKMVCVSSALSRGLLPVWEITRCEDMGKDGWSETAPFCGELAGRWRTQWLCYRGVESADIDMFWQRESVTYPRNAAVKLALLHHLALLLHHVQLHVVRVLVLLHVVGLLLLGHAHGGVLLLHHAVHGRLLVADHLLLGGVLLLHLGLHLGRVPRQQATGEQAQEAALAGLGVGVEVAVGEGAWVGVGEDVVVAFFGLKAG
jgi:hypothetical protein